MEKDKIFNEDCIEGMKRIPDGSIDLVVTDPPYLLTSRGGTGTMAGYLIGEKGRRGRVFEHNDIKIEDYLSELYRVLKPDAHCYIMCNNLNLPHFFDVIVKSDFHFVKLLVWDKQTKICGTYYMSQVEHIFFLRKGKNKPINDCSTSDLLSFVNKRDKDNDGKNIHDSQKPIELFLTLIRNSSDENELVLDPFLGSGTTAIACIRANRHFVGFEKDTNYYKKAVERIKAEQMQLRLF